jgi:large subunit ribosomal protein L17
MRHGDKVNNLGRTASHRRALLSNMTCSLIAHKRIMTTLAKAKALRMYAEPLITRSKVDSMHNRRTVFSYLQDKEAIKELFGVVGDKVANRPGGYTRIIKMPRRAGDAADMAMIELVDFNEIYHPNDTAGAAKKTRRSRRGSGTGTAATTATATPVADVTNEATTAPDTDASATANAVVAAHEAADKDMAAEDVITTVIPTTDDSNESADTQTESPEAPAQEEGGEGAGA